MTDIETILSERQSVYGDYDNVACSSQAIKCIIQNGASYRRLSITERESLDMIAGPATHPSRSSYARPVLASALPSPSPSSPQNPAPDPSPPSLGRLPKR